MYKLIYTLLTAILLQVPGENVSAQQGTYYVRIARLVIDSTKLEDYKKALKEHARRC